MKTKDEDLTLIPFDNVLAEAMKNPEFAESYSALREQRRLARMLKEARIEKSLTQAQVAELSGINVKNISRLERGVTSPTFGTLMRYARALGGSFYFKFDQP